jgi:hypothetical protein
MMLSTVIQQGHYTRMKSKALKESLLESYREQLDGADTRERKRIMKQIEEQIENVLDEDAKKWGVPANTSNGMPGTATTRAYV